MRRTREWSHKASGRVPSALRGLVNRSITRVSCTICLRTYTGGQWRSSTIAAVRIARASPAHNERGEASNNSLVTDMTTPSAVMQTRDRVKGHPQPMPLNPGTVRRGTKTRVQ